MGRGEIRKQSQSSSKKGAASGTVFFVPQSSDAVATPEPKKGGGKRNGSGSGKKGAASATLDDSDDEGDGGDSSIGVSGSTYREIEFDVTELSESVEMLQDKRPSTRIKGLRKLLSLLRGSSAVETLASLQDAYFESTMSGLMRILSRPFGFEEGGAAMEAICLLSLAQGPHDDEFLSKFSPILTNLLEHEELNQHALFTLGFASYLHDPNSTRAVELCESLLCEEDGVLSIEIDEVSDDLKSQAVRSWCLLGGLLPPQDLVARAHERAFAALVDMVLEANTETKLVAGEALAFCWECAAMAYPANAGDPAELGAKLCKDPELVERALNALRQASRESSKHISKKDRKEQRSAFRDICSFVLDGEPPEESVRFTGADFTATSFRELGLLQALRRVLGDCFERGIIVYPLVLELVGLDPTELQEILGGQVKKGSTLEKKRSAYRKQDRRLKEVFEDSDD